jgi:hypothetical protein
MLFKSLDYIIKNVMIESYQENDNNYAMLLQIAANGARHLNFALPINIKTVEIPYDSQLRYIDLPPDCVSYSKIGVLLGDRLVFLGLNNNIAKERHYNGCGIVQPNNPAFSTALSSDPIDIYFYNYYWNNTMGALYGFGSGGTNAGEYTLDAELNRISFSANVLASSIFLEYKSNGIQSDGAILIAEENIEVLIEYVHWRRLKFKQGTNAYDKQTAFKDFVNAKKAARRRFGATLEEFYDYSILGYSQAPKN